MDDEQISLGHHVVDGILHVGQGLAHIAGGGQIIGQIEIAARAMADIVGGMEVGIPFEVTAMAEHIHKEGVRHGLVFLLLASGLS
jgi:hypothetical protein